MTHVARQPGVDVARGLAVVSMVVAHTCPVGGVFNVSEYLTAPLFALLIGVSLTYAWHNSGVSFGRFWLAEVLRGALLFALGVALQLAYAQIFDVLMSLGLLTALLPPVVLLGRRSPAALVALVGVLAVAVPPLKLAGEAWLAAHDPTFSFFGKTTVAGNLVWWTAAHPVYRLTQFVSVAGLGVLVARPLAEGRPPQRTLALAALACAAASGVAVFVGKRTGIGGAPYDGTYPEVAASTLVAVAVLLAATWVVRAVPPNDRTLRLALTPLVATGRLSLTCYTLQVLTLAAVTTFVTQGVDDSWPVMVGVIALLLAFATVWHKGFGPLGPAEWFVRLPSRLLTHRHRITRSAP